MRVWPRLCESDNHSEWSLVKSSPKLQRLQRRRAPWFTRIFSQLTPLITNLISSLSFDHFTSASSDSAVSWSWISSIMLVSIWSQLAFFLNSSLLSVSISCWKINFRDEIINGRERKKTFSSYWKLIDNGASPPTVLEGDICLIRGQLMKELAIIAQSNVTC